MTERRIFSVDEANELIPYLNLEFERIARLRRHVTEHFRRLQNRGVEVDLNEPIDAQALDPEDRPDVMRLVQMVREIARAIERVNELGGLVKDLDLGLVDFYSVVDGKPAYLCWQYGEPTITFFHPVDKGFAARKELTGRRREGVLYN